MDIASDPEDKKAINLRQAFISRFPRNPALAFFLLRYVGFVINQMMMIPIALAFFVVVGMASAAPTSRGILDSADPLDPYPTKPRLSFRSDGTFKITVFSDLHYGENAWDWWGPEHDMSSTQLMKTILEDEKPDFAVLNGDLITGENTFRENATAYIDQIVSSLNDAGVPFCSTHGNHDNQVNITHLEEILHEQRISPLSYTRVAPPGVGGEYGPGNYWVPVYAKPSDFAPTLIIWAFDSRGGFSLGANSTGVPDWVDSSVATWIEQQVDLMDSTWGPAKDSRASLAFVHIPPHAIQAVSETLNSTINPGMNADSLGQGSTQASNPSSIGNDQPFWDTLNNRVMNLHAVISGHDHGNEWCAREPTKDVIFCFDKHSGYGGYTSEGWGYGARNILIRSPSPHIGPETWIRLEDGETRARVILDSNYL